MKSIVAASLMCASLLASPKVFAGRETGNGGDLCEDRIRLIRDDLISWIHQGGADSLKLPVGLTIETYKAQMLANLVSASVSCTTDVLKVGQAEKSCLNYTDGAKPRLECNLSRFQSIVDADQYILIHHEYAGLAGFEVTSGETSNYEISNQISGYLVDELVKKLAVKPPTPEAPGFHNPSLRCQASIVGSSPLPADRDAMSSHGYKLRRMVSWNNWSPPNTGVIGTGGGFNCGPCGYDIGGVVTVSPKEVYNLSTFVSANPDRSTPEPLKHLSDQKLMAIQKQHPIWIDYNLYVPGVPNLNESIDITVGKELNWSDMDPITDFAFMENLDHRYAKQILHLTPDLYGKDVNVLGLTLNCTLKEYGLE